jgi:hypothetical protein
VVAEYALQMLNYSLLSEEEQEGILFAVNSMTSEAVKQNDEFFVRAVVAKLVAKDPAEHACPLVPALIDVLVEKGADLGTRENFPLTAAVIHNHKPLVDALVRRGASLRPIHKIPFHLRADPALIKFLWNTEQNREALLRVMDISTAIAQAALESNEAFFAFVASEPALKPELRNLVNSERSSSLTQFVTEILL